MALFPISNTEIIKRASALIKPYLGKQVKSVSDIAIPVIVLNQQPFGESVVITESYAAGAAPSAKVIYTVPTGKKLYLTHILMTNTYNGGSIGLNIQDGVTGPGVIRTNLTQNAVPNNFPLSPAVLINNSLNMESTQQPANSTYTWTILGWLENV